MENTDRKRSDLWQPVVLENVETKVDVFSKGYPKTSDSKPFTESERWSHRFRNRFFIILHHDKKKKLECTIKRHFERERHSHNFYYSILL